MCVLLKQVLWDGYYAYYYKNTSNYSNLKGVQKRLAYMYAALLNKIKRQHTCTPLFCVGKQRRHVLVNKAGC